ncbi:class I SAM-dependent methyltransferase [Enterococcus olivae]
MELREESERLTKIRKNEAESHKKQYAEYLLYEKGSWLSRPVAYVMKHIPERTDSLQVLDLGCGVGRNAIAIAQNYCSRIDAVDLLPVALTKLEGYAKDYGVSSSITGHLSSVEDFLLIPESYDLILAVSVLEHVSSWSAFVSKLTEIREALTSGGRFILIISTEIVTVDSSMKPVDPMFELLLTVKEIKQVLSEVFRSYLVIDESIEDQAYPIDRDNHQILMQSKVYKTVLQKS